MTINNSQDALKVLKQRLDLLSRGIIIETARTDKPVRNLQSFYGGTGPRGMKYFISYHGEEPESMISLPIYPNDHYLAKYAMQTKRDESNHHNLIAENGIILKGVPPHSLRSQMYEGSSSINLFFEVHPYDTCTLNVATSCRHYENNEKCRFCTTDFLLNNHNAPKRFSDEHLVGVVKLAMEKNINLRTITVSGGTITDPEESISQMITLAKKLKEITDLDLYFQIEPTDDCTLLKELSQWSEGIGICLDVYDENIRKKICPGKSKTPKEKYFEVWEKAVEYFGRGNVESHCVIGLGEDIHEVLRTIEKSAVIGVKVTLLHVRPGSKELGDCFVPSYIDKGEEYLDLHIRTAQLLNKYGIPYLLKEGAGCLGCNGCNAMTEACRYASLMS